MCVLHAIGKTGLQFNISRIILQQRYFGRMPNVCWIVDFQVCPGPRQEKAAPTTDTAPFRIATLDSNARLACGVHQLFNHLPYRHTEITQLVSLHLWRPAPRGKIAVPRKRQASLSLCREDTLAFFDRFEYLNILDLHRIDG